MRSPAQRAVEAGVVAVGAAILGVGVASQGGLALGIGVALSVAAVLVTSHSVAVAVGLAIGWLPVAGRMSIVDLGSLPDVTVERVGVLFVCGAVVVAYANRGLAMPTDSRLRFALWVWAPALCLVAVSALNSAHVQDAIREFGDAYLLPTVVIVVLALVPWSERDVSRILIVGMTGAVAWVGLGFVEIATRWSPYTDTGQPYAAFAAYVRPGGPFINPAALGLVLGCIAVVAAAWILRHGRGRFVVGWMMGILAVGLGVTLTRSAWVGFVLGIAVVVGYLAPKSRVAGAGTLLGVVAVGIAVADLIGLETVLSRVNDEGTAMNRLVMYATSVAVSLRHPFTGLGIGAYKDVAASSLIGWGSVSAHAGAGVLAPHNTLLLAAVESGWPVAAALATAFLLLMVFAFESRKRSGSWASVGLLGLLVCYAANALFFDAQLQVHTGIVLGMIIGPLLGHLAHSSADCEGVA